MDWSALYLLMMILARMSGFVLFNPFFGRRGIPGIVRAGLILLLTVTVAAMGPAQPPVAGTVLEMAVVFLLEMALGYLLGLVMNIFFYIPLLAGDVVDTQMGLAMARTYDPASGASSTTTASLLNVLMTLLFFAANGHHTLLRIVLGSGDVVPFGAVALGDSVYQAVLQIFIDCTIMAVKLSMPILAAELLGQVGMGILMKAIPQINVFVINIDLKVIIGLVLLLILIAPLSEYLMDAEIAMLRAIRDLMPMAAP